MKSQLPPEFHEEVKTVPKITLIREILLEYYNIPKEGGRIRELNRMINSCMKKDCAEFRISELSLSRNIIWRHYGYEGVPEETKQQKNIITYIPTPSLICSLNFVDLVSFCPCLWSFSL
jgi:hypothetical protein